MQQLIELVNQNLDLNNNVNGILLILAIFGILAAILAIFEMVKRRKSKNTKSEPCTVVAIIALIAITMPLGDFIHQQIVNHNKINDNDIKIEKIEKSAITSQASKYPYCVLLEDSNSTSATQILVFFNNKQNAISFIQKNQNSKRIFLSNYLSSESDYLSQESNQSIKNNFDQMQVKSIKKALTQMINESRDMQ